MVAVSNQFRASFQPVLIIVAGLSGTGKTTIARELARQLSAVYLRIDTIEQEMRSSELLAQPIHDAGYCMAYALAEDNLKLGQTVIADSVNPLQVTRDAWMSVAHRANAKAIEVEVTCSDSHEHRHRVESRVSDIKELRLPSWQEVVAREYEPWNRSHVVIDTARQTVSQAVGAIRDAL
jgi:predicted kinase